MAATAQYDDAGPFETDPVGLYLDPWAVLAHDVAGEALRYLDAVDCFEAEGYAPTFRAELIA